MSGAGVILKLIEDVAGPHRCAFEIVQRLQEIDLATEYYLREINGGGILLPFGSVRYSTSRDALKGVRPKGFNWTIHEQRVSEMPPAEMGFKNFTCSIWKRDDSGNMVFCAEGKADTEELAELQAIIQTIEWERKMP